MLIPLGILASSGGAVAGSYELISTTVLTGTQASVTFDVSTLASTYKHLQIRFTGRNNGSGGGSTLSIRLNSDSGSNYSRHQLYGTSSSVGSGATTSTTSAWTGFTNGTDNASTIFNAGIVDLLDIFSTSKNKTLRSFSGEPTSSYVLFRSSAWLSTSVVTSIALIPESGSLVSGSRFSIYGIKGA
jgi:hypothetical protein